MDKKKVCVIILDGMPYSILNGLLNNGIMPHLEKIYNNSKRGIIQSDIPITPIVWSSMVTGKTPFQTGFSDVRTIDKFYNIYKQSIGRKNIWAYLNEKGIRCGLFNAPYIYPVQKINGFMTTGKEGGGTNTYRDFTYPYNLKNKIFDIWGGGDKYIHHIEKEKLKNDPVSLIETVKKVNTKRVECSIYAIKKYNVDFFLGFFMETDKLFHVTWNNLVNVASGNFEGTIEKQLVDLFKTIDKNFHSLFSSFEENSYKIVLSDHGFGPIEYRFKLDQWLVNNGFTKTYYNNNKPHKTKPEFKSLIKQVMPYSIGNKILRVKNYFNSFSNDEFPETKDKSNLKNVDWKQTKAFGLTGISIYINDIRFNHSQVNSKEQYNTTVKNIVLKLKKLRLPTGELAFNNNILTKEDFNISGFGTNGPDIIINPDLCSCNRPDFDNIVPSGSDTYFLPTSGGDQGTHRKEGIFLISGSGINKGEILKKIDHTEFPALVFKLFNIDNKEFYPDRISRDIF